MSAMLQSSADCNASCSFYLVSCQHPNLNSSRFQGLYGQLNIVLESILHTGHSEEFEVTFKIRKYSLDCLLTIAQLR